MSPLWCKFGEPKKKREEGGQEQPGPHHVLPVDIVCV